jgi:signal transduction histidine kinase
MKTEVNRNERERNFEETSQNKNQKLIDREAELADKQEELQAQKEELTAAVEELVNKNNSLTDALSQLQKRNKELDALLYRASHDLKSPVTSLQGLVNLMESEITTTEQKSMMGYMNQKLSQMNGILKSMELLAQAAFEKIEYEKLTVKSIVDQVLSDLSYLPQRENVSIHFTFTENMQVVSDRLFLYNILKSLLSNAIIFRDVLKPGNVWLEINATNGRLLIEVTDDGEGMPANISSHVFDMFYRGSERSLGAGLGLYIAKTAVERMKGEIRWISRSGKTTFQIDLPEPNQ